jgi:hypothetical protein
MRAAASSALATLVRGVSSFGGSSMPRRGCARRSGASGGSPSRRSREPRPGGSQCASARGPHGSPDRPRSAIRDRRSRSPPCSELGRQDVSQRSLVALECRRGVPSALLAAATPHSTCLHAVEPLVGKLAERRTRSLSLIDGVLTLQCCRQPAEDLGALLEGVRPHHSALARLPAATTIGRLAAASGPVAAGGRTSRLVAHVDACSLWSCGTRAPPSPDPGPSSVRPGQAASGGLLEERASVVPGPTP